jgi:hypothetical protein
MKDVKLAVLHFYPVEKYPPAMNMVNFLWCKGDVKVTLYTTWDRNDSWFRPLVRIKRFGKESRNTLWRYLTYLIFNAGVFFSLLVFRPTVILYYETYSSFPALLYKKLFRKVRVFIHYHEYTSVGEYRKLSGFVRSLWSLERQFYPKADWISHTNRDRLNLFKKDHPQIKFGILQSLANYPPRSWYKLPRATKCEDNVLKIVYTGALSLATMHTEAFANWVIAQNGNVKWDIYSGNFDDSVGEYFRNLGSEHIELKEEVNYYFLVETLGKYDIGVILYNGHIPNFVYNVPNKVLEYYAAGLNVWCSKDLISVLDFKNKHRIPSIFMIDFSELNDNFEPQEQICKPRSQAGEVFCFENEYDTIYRALLA